jgi:hypothetical protein
LLAGKSGAKIGSAPGNRVLMWAFARCLLSGLQERGWGVEIWKSLGKIDGAICIRNPRHAADDRLAKHTGTLTRFWHSSDSLGNISRYHDCVDP